MLCEKTLDEVLNKKTETGDTFVITTEDTDIEYNANDYACEISVNAVMLDEDTRNAEQSTIAYRVSTSENDEDWRIGTIEDAKKALREYVEDMKNWYKDNLEEV